MGDLAHLKLALVGCLFVYDVDSSQQLELVLLHFDAKLIKSQNDPLKLLLTDRILENTYQVLFLQQVQAVLPRHFLLVGSTVSVFIACLHEKGPVVVKKGFLIVLRSLFVNKEEKDVLDEVFGQVGMTVNGVEWRPLFM